MASAPMKPYRARDSEDPGFKSHNLWVGSLTTDTTESDLTELFGKFGDIDRITAYASRSFAFIYYRRVEEAVAAKEALQGADLNGSQIKIEYARPAKPCRSLWVGGISPSLSKDDLEAEFNKFGKIEDLRFLRERKTAFIDYYEIDDAVHAKSMNGQRMGGSYLRVDFLRSQAPRKDQWAGSYDNKNGNGDNSQPSNVLWIGYPPTVQIDEQMLHNAMILFGEIERIKSYPSRHFSLVEFRSVEEARRAKEALQGRLFNDPRITIMYTNDELSPERDDTGFYSGVKRSRPDMLFASSSPRSSVVPGSMRPFRSSSERSYNGQGILPSPAQGMRSNLGSWDGYDRESKRTRRDGSVDADYMWRGVVAKGGTPVCRARCVPIGKGIEIKLPEVVNCSARTGLDMLEKHYTEAVGFEIVFFLPDSEEDFASYTEFLRYLGSKNRAGVAKLDDGTTLFLVPPSDFLTDVLKVSGPERLYGVVLNLAPPQPPPVPVAAPYRQEPQVAVSLSPELLASLASILPATSQQPQTISDTLTVVSTVPQSNGIYNVETPSNQSFQLYGNQYNQSVQLPSRYSPASNTANYSNGMVHSNTQYQGQSVNMPHNNYAVYSQSMTQPEPSAAYHNYAPVQANYNGATTNQAHNLHSSHLETPSQAAQVQPVLTDGEVDKDQRYKSTLQFAANLLLQIQQKQQQSSSTVAGQGGP